MKSICGWKAVLLAGASLGVLHAQEGLSLQKTQDAQKVLSTKVPGKKLWEFSLVSLSVANVLDVHSSYGKRELNSTLAGPSGVFGARGVLIKSGFQGGLIGFEYLMLRRHSHGFLDTPSRSKLYKTFSIINFASSAVLSGIAAHNYTIPRQHP
jgi:hypothetical protein